MAEEIFLSQLKTILLKHKVQTEYKNECLISSSKEKNRTYTLSLKEIFENPQCDISAKKFAGIILSKLQLNQTVFARKCSIERVEKGEAEGFLNTYHIMNSTSSAFNLGLYFNNELITIATFSKGRKMNRLQENWRSYELIRYCSKFGITVTGGLSKLVKQFCEIKKAGDVMTYVSKEFSEGQSFAKAGFVQTYKGGKDERNIKMIFTPHLR